MISDRLRKTVAGVRADLADPQIVHMYEGIEQQVDAFCVVIEKHADLLASFEAKAIELRAQEQRRERDGE